MNKLRRIDGRAWKCGDAVTTYQIIPQRYWDIMNPDPDAELLGQHLFDGIAAADAPECAFKPAHAEIIIAGQEFGCGGKSIVHPVLAMKGAGVKLVIAESFSRFFFRNAVNLALPILTCHGITAWCKTGARLNVDLETGTIVDCDTGKLLQGEPTAPLVLDIMDAGGEIPYYCLILPTNGK